jgi:1-acyl-sn-glycerol-3-phosphate acyltransferase
MKSVPRKGGLLIAANHASILDIPFLGCGIRRRLSYIGRHDLFPIPVLKTFIKYLGWIPILDDKGDRAAFRRAEQLLLRGEAVVIFPEGVRTRTGQLSKGRPGIGRLVAKTRCAVLPGYIDGTLEALPIHARRVRLHPVTVIYGQLLRFPHMTGISNKKDYYRHVVETVMRSITELQLSHEQVTSEHRFNPLAASMNKSMLNAERTSPGSKMDDCGPA